MFMNEYSVIEKGKVNAIPATLITQAAVLEARVNMFLSGARATLGAADQFYHCWWSQVKLILKDF